MRVTVRDGETTSSFQLRSSPPKGAKIERRGNVPPEDMLRTFNVGVGLTVVAAQEATSEITAHLNKFFPAYPIGEIVRGEKKVRFTGNLP